MTVNKLLDYLTFPWYALWSTRFYYRVLMNISGVGLTYAMLLCMAIALPATLQVQKSLDLLKKLELSTIVTHIPASFISSDGVLSPKNPQDNKIKIISNSSGESVIAYNLNNDKIEQTIPLTITSYALLINSTEGVISMPWTAFYGSQGGEFEPLQIAQGLDQIFNASFMSVWMIVSLWLFAILSLTIGVSACAIRIIAKTWLKIVASFIICLRLASFGSTAVALLMLGQFYFNYSLSYLFLCFIPAVYALRFLYEIRYALNRSLKDSDYALRQNNLLYSVFENLSRINFDSNINPRNLPEYSTLDEEQKALRRAQVEKMTANIGSVLIELSVDREKHMTIIAVHAYTKDAKLLNIFKQAHEANQANPNVDDNMDDFAKLLGKDELKKTESKDNNQDGTFMP